MADFELLAPGGHQKLVDEVVDRLDLKADIDGYYAQLTAGAADNLTGRGDAITAEFLYRTAGGTADIETGQAVAKSIHGRTLVWNQLVRNGNFSSSDNWSLSGGTRTTANNVVTIVTSANYATFEQTPQAGASVILGHKYLFSYEIKTDSAVQAYVAASEISKRMALNTGSSYYGNWCKRAAILECQDTYSLGISFQSPTGADGNTIQLTNAQLFDLTAMFGAGNEPSTVAEFEALFPLPYYEYDAGSLLSVNMEGIETVGFNQIEDVPYTANGAAVAFDKSKAVRLIAGQEYQFTCDGVSGATAWRFLYKVFDMDGNLFEFSGNPSMVNSGLFTSVSGNAQWVNYNTNNKGFLHGSNSAWKNDMFTPAVDMYMMVFLMQTSSSSVVQNPCLHLVWSGRRDGEYEPYWSSQRLIDAATYFPDGMRSAGSVYDELTSTEAITRVGVVDLGTLDWKAVSDSNRVETTGKFVSDVRLAGKSNTTKPDITCDARYTVMPYYAGGNDAYNTEGSISIEYMNSGMLFIYDSALAGKTAAEVKAALSGVMLHYALATPTVTPIDPALNLSYRVDDFGTERIMVPENERSAPPVLDIAYGLNVVDFVRRAPSEYISAASFRQYLLARDAHDGTTTTMTWDDTDNRYEFAITDTVTEG